MDKTTHTYLTQLRIISKIPRNGLLVTTNNEINIYRPGMVNWVLRKFHGDGKGPTTTFLTDFYSELDRKTLDLLRDIRREKHVEQQVVQVQLLAALTEKIFESLEGIANLIGSYKSFPETVSRLEHIVEDMIHPTIRRCMQELDVRLPNDQIIPWNLRKVAESDIMGDAEKKMHLPDAEKKMHLPNGVISYSAMTPTPPIACPSQPGSRPPPPPPPSPAY
jgi:hypothetical protein